MLTKQTFNKICPAIVQQIDSQKCSDKTEEHKPVVVKETKAKGKNDDHILIPVFSN